MTDRVVIRSSFDEGQDIFTKARPVDSDGSVIYSGTVTRIDLEVFDMGSEDPTSPILTLDSETHTGLAITTVFGTQLSTTGWDADDEGWSFKHQLTATGTADPSEDLEDATGEEGGTIGGHRYKLEYKCNHSSDGVFYIIHVAQCESVSIL